MHTNNSQQQEEQKFPQFEFAYFRGLSHRKRNEEHNSQLQKPEDDGFTRIDISTLLKPRVIPSYDYMPIYKIVLNAYKTLGRRKEIEQKQWPKNVEPKEIADWLNTKLLEITPNKLIYKEDTPDVIYEAMVCKSSHEDISCLVGFMTFMNAEKPELYEQFNIILACFTQGCHIQMWDDGIFEYTIDYLQQQAQELKDEYGLDGNAYELIKEQKILSGEEVDEDDDENTKNEDDDHSEIVVEVMNLENEYNYYTEGEAKEYLMRIRKAGKKVSPQKVKLAMRKIKAMKITPKLKKAILDFGAAVTHCLQIEAKLLDYVVDPAINEYLGGSEETLMYQESMSILWKEGIGLNTYCEGIDEQWGNYGMMEPIKSARWTAKKFEPIQDNSSEGVDSIIKTMHLLHEIRIYYAERRKK